MDGKRQTRPSDHEISRLAQRQYGVVSRAQLIELGLGEDAIDGRLRSGRLHRLHCGVYAFGRPDIPREGRWLAAVLTVGGDAVLSHRSAAQLWGVRRTEGNRIDIASPCATRSRPAIRRRYLRLAPDEITERQRIPVTTLARTLFDIAGELSPEPFEATLREAEYVHRFRLEELERLLALYPGRRGAKTIKICLHRLGRGPRGRARPGLEVRFAALLTGTDLPVPALNALLDLDGFKVEADCLWRDQRVVVELDGGESHGTRVAFEADRERDRRLQAAGWRVIRVTWRQLDDPNPLLADLRRLLAPGLRFPAISTSSINWAASRT